MKNVKRILSILMVCAMLVAALPMVVAAEDYINANDKWFGYGVDCYLLNPSVAADDADGLWYQLTAEQDGILVLEHSYKNVDYTITVTVNGVTYEGGCVDGVIYNGPIMTYPMQVGNVASVNIVTADAAAGTVYANMKIIAGDSADTIKVKSEGIVVYVDSGETVYFQDDSLNAVYATKGVLVTGDVADTTFYAVTTNSESGSATQKATTDSDGDGIIEVKLGGSLGSAGAPPVKPAWAIENNSGTEQMYTLTVADDAHECSYDSYDACTTCGLEKPHVHEWDNMYDRYCNVCGEWRDAETPLNLIGTSISPEVNGLAWLVEVKVDGITLDDTTANYDNATLDGCKVVKMGAVVSNNYAELGYVPGLNDVDGVRVVDIEAKKMYSINEDGTVTFAIRVINIPDEYKDREIDIVPYIIYLDANGVEQTMSFSSYAAYNWFT